MHEGVPELLAAQAFGTLTLTERQQVLVHLADCSTCQEALAGWRAVQRGVREAAAVAPPGPAVLEGALARIDAEQQMGRQVRRPADRPRPRRAHRVALVAAALIALLGASAVAVASLDPSRGAWLALERSLAVRGEKLWLKGAGCKAGSAVSYTLGTTQLKPTGGSVPPDSEGYFVGSLSVPASVPLGMHDLAVGCTGADSEPLVQHAKVKVIASVPCEQPGIHLDDPLGRSAAVKGSVVAVSGGGCRDGSRVTFTLDGKPLKETTRAWKGGGFGAFLSIPARVSVGTHKVAARCTGPDGQPLVMHTKIRIVPPLPEKPFVEADLSTGPGGPLYLKGLGCRDGSRVTFTLDGKPLKETTRAWKGGGFGTSVSIPAGMAVGTHKVAARCTGRDGRPLVMHTRFRLAP